jgi:DNA gyrase subunit A
MEAESHERTAYLKMRRAVAGETAEDEAAEPAGEDANGNGHGPGGPLPQERYVAMSEAEQVILTVSEKGFGKRTSSFEYRITGRGGKGIGAMAVNARNGRLVASFPVEDGDEIMLVTDGGQLIRCPVDGIRIAGRNTQGVIVFNTAANEKVVAVDRIPEVGEGHGGEGNGSEPPAKIDG